MPGGSRSRGDAADRAAGARVAGKVFTTREIARLARLTPSRVRRCVRAGVVAPERGPRRRYEYTLRDLMLLRATRALLDARLGPKRIAEVIEQLKAQLGSRRDVSSLRLTVERDRVLVSDGQTTWQPGSGQMLFQFGAKSGRATPVRHIAPDDEDEDAEAVRSFVRGLALDKRAPEAAKTAYREVLRRDPTAVPAMVNLGRLEHASGNLDEAQELYRRALVLDPSDRVAAFNLAVLAEDRGDWKLAVKRYQQVLHIAPDLADAHHRLAQIYRQLGKREASQRHTRAYRALLRRRS
jgi:tetratricopeptide (TPR) repeat protein